MHGLMSGATTNVRGCVLLEAPAELIGVLENAGSFEAGSKD